MMLFETSNGELGSDSTAVVADEDARCVDTRRRSSNRQNAALRFQRLQIVVILFVTTIIILLMPCCFSSDEPDLGGVCRLDIWAYSTKSLCSQLQPPTLIGVLYADGVCRTVQTEANATSPYYNLLPGSYSAMCAGTNKIHFLHSGCLAPNCSSGTAANKDGVCKSDATIPSSLYAGANVTKFPVVDISNLTSNRFRCSTLSTSDTEITVTFVIFGDCSDPTCKIASDGGNNNMTTAPVKAPITVVRPVTVSPTASSPLPQPSTPTAPAPTTNRSTSSGNRCHSDFFAIIIFGANVNNGFMVSSIIIAIAIIL